VSGREDHVFQFDAGQIAAHAQAKAEYHAGRLDYWRGEYDRSVARVEETVAAEVVKQPVTNGYDVRVVVDYGDPAAYQRMQQSFQKIGRHTELLEHYRAQAKVYKTQGKRTYELTAADVAYFGLDGRRNSEDEEDQ
jgi:hypothetical protein